MQFEFTKGTTDVIFLVRQEKHLGKNKKAMLCIHWDIDQGKAFDRVPREVWLEILISNFCTLTFNIINYLLFDNVFMDQLLSIIEFNNSTSIVTFVSVQEYWSITRMTVFDDHWTTHMSGTLRHTCHVSEYFKIILLNENLEDLIIWY